MSEPRDSLSSVGPPEGRGPRRRLGLRGQIMIALFVAFAISFALLAFASIQLTDRARAVDRLRAAQATTEALALAVDAATTTSDDLGVDRALRAVVDGEAIVGVEIVRPGKPRVRRGIAGRGASLDARLVVSGGVVRVWLGASDATSETPLANLLLLYAAVTGAAILLLTYVALTNLIVRPVESLTRASERLARGATNVSVPERGGAEVARLAASFNDMAAQLRSERAALEVRLRELEQTTSELRTAQEGLVRSEKLASVGRLAAGVAHEIGNPLAAILGLVDLLRESESGLDEKERAEFLRRIHAETERIHKIIRDLLDFSRQGTAEDEPTASSDLREVVDDAVRLVAPQKDLRAITIERRFDDEVPLVRGAAHRLVQVVLNLLLNAADAIGGEGAIRVEVSRDGDFVVLVVTDTGPGIAPAVLAHIFEPFITTKPAGQGTGLGLAVSHTLVQGLGGILTASNPPTGGARFEVRLPLASSPILKNSQDPPSSTNPANAT